MRASERIACDVLAELFGWVEFGEGEWADECRGSDIPGPEEAAIQREAELAVDDYVEDLDRRARLVVTRLYGLDGDEPATHAEIARDLGVTETRVRRLEQRALLVLRGLLAGEGFDGRPSANPTCFGGVIERFSERADNRPADPLEVS